MSYEKNKSELVKTKDWTDTHVLKDFFDALKVRMSPCILKYTYKSGGFGRIAFLRESEAFAFVERNLQTNPDVLMWNIVTNGELK